MSSTSSNTEISTVVLNHMSDEDTFGFGCQCNHLMLLNPTVTFGNILASTGEREIPIPTYHPADRALKRNSSDLRFRRTREPSTEVRSYINPTAPGERSSRPTQGEVTRVQGVVSVGGKKHEVVITLYAMYSAATLQYI